MKFDLKNPDPDNRSINIEINNLTEAQAVAIEELMAVWQFINDKKFFYWTAFCIDGFLDWNMEINVNGRKPERFMGEIGNRKGIVKFEQPDGTLHEEEMYFLDYLKVKKALEEMKANSNNDENKVA